MYQFETAGHFMFISHPTSYSANCAYALVLVRTLFSATASDGGKVTMLLFLMSE